LGGGRVFLGPGARDEQGANLDRVQIIKGWLDRDGNLQERVFDIAVSDGRGINAEGRATAAVQSSVDVATASYSNSVGAGEFLVFWEDPDFSADARAFYYVRVLEIPTPRWTAYDSAFFELAMDPAVPMAHQERAYSSPIWYSR